MVGGFTALGVLAIARASRDEPITFLEAIGVFLGGGAVASLPDVIDPPTSPRHRSVGHSVAGVAGIGIALKNLEANPNITKNTKDIVYAMSGAYLSHIVLDATTPAGIPLISN